jgi:hypothetical protein
MTAGTEGKQVHEDEALAVLVNAIAVAGHVAALTLRPEQVPAHPLDVDAMLCVDGTEWAVDHCLLSRDDQLPGAFRKLEGRLGPRVAAVASAHGVALTVSYRALATSTGKQETEAYYQRVLDLVRTAATTGRSDAGDGFTSATVVAGAPAGQVYWSRFLTMTGNPAIGEQIREGISRALTKKLTKQLRKAKDQGYRVLLLLDQLPRPGVEGSYTNFLAADQTIMTAIRPELDTYPGVVDQIWLRAGDGSARLLAVEGRGF